MNGITSNGLAGMLNSQQAMQHSAHAIATAPVAKPSDPAIGLSPASDLGASSTGATGVSNTHSTINHSDPLHEMINVQQQAHLFNASARVVHAGDESLGRLIDEYR